MSTNEIGFLVEQFRKGVADATPFAHEVVRQYVLGQVVVAASCVVAAVLAAILMRRCICALNAEDNPGTFCGVVAAGVALAMSVACGVASIHHMVAPIPTMLGL